MQKCKYYIVFFKYHLFHSRPGWLAASPTPTPPPPWRRPPETLPSLHALAAKPTDVFFFFFRSHYRNC